MTEEKKKEVIEILDASLATVLDQNYMQMNQAQRLVDAFRIARMAVKNMDNETKCFNIKSGINEMKLYDEIINYKRNHPTVEMCMSEETAKDLPNVKPTSLCCGNEVVKNIYKYYGYHIFINNDLKYGEVELR